MNAEFQRIASRGKKAFLSDLCKEIKENNRMGKTKDLFKKMKDTKGTFHAKMGTIKDRNGIDLTEAEDIKKPQVTKILKTHCFQKKEPNRKRASRCQEFPFNNDKEKKLFNLLSYCNF